MNNNTTKIEIDFNTDTISQNIDWDLLYLLTRPIQGLSETNFSELKTEIDNISQIKNNHTKYEQT